MRWKAYSLISFVSVVSYNLYGTPFINLKVLNLKNMLNIKIHKVNSQMFGINGLNVFSTLGSQALFKQRNESHLCLGCIHI